MVKPCPWPLRDLLPHAPPMVLLDEAVGCDDTRVVAAVTIRPDHPFATEDGVPAHVGIELMAQTCGVYAGVQACTSGKPVRPGYLLGTRNFVSHVAGFAPGDKLEITAKVVLRDDELASFDCRIDRDGTTIAEARLSLFQPKDLEAAGRGS